MRLYQQSRFALRVAKKTFQLGFILTTKAWSKTRSRRTGKFESYEKPQPWHINQENNESIETPGYLNSNNERLYYVHHKCVGPCMGAVLLVGAVASERTNSYLTWVRWARKLANEGFDVLRFDLRATGESEGKLEETSFAAWENDVEQALTHLEKLSPGIPIIIHGMRFGALLGARIFAARKCRALLLWEPIENVSLVIKDNELSKLGEHLLAKTHNTKQDLNKENVQGNLVSLSNNFCSTEIQDFNIPSLNAMGKERFWQAIYLTENSKKIFDSTDHEIEIFIPQPCFWQESPHLVHQLDGLFAASLALIKKGVLVQQ